MYKFTKESNGYTLEIALDDKSLIAELDKDIKEMEDLKKDLASGKIDENDEEYRWEYSMCKVYGDIETDFCTPEEIIADRNDFKETIEKLIADEGSTLWGMAELKKNGTFKKTCKPMIRQAINGIYWEENYGWNTLVLRMTPIDDTHARIELDTIVVHW